jgi:heme/copper-type cytochrome/quinol oxidase subunit 2
MFNLAFFLQQGLNPDQISHIVVAAMAILPIIILVCLAIVIIPFWFISKKAGLSPWLSLLVLVPCVGTLILLYVLAFAEWKVVPAPQLGYPPPYPPPPMPPQLPPQ